MFLPLIPPGAVLLAMIVGHPGLGHAATSSSGLADVVYPWGLLLLPFLLGLTIWVLGLRRRMTSTVRTLDAECRQRQRSESELGTVLASMTSLVLELDNQGRVLRHIPTRYEFEHLAPAAAAGPSGGDHPHGPGPELTGARPAAPGADREHGHGQPGRGQGHSQ